MAAKTRKNASEYKIFTLADSARVKGMWAGALERTLIPGLSGIYPKSNSTGYEIREISRAHTPALLKIIDEGLVNASDHWKENAKQKRAVDRVSRVELTLDKNTGRITIENDGPGIPIVKHQDASATAGHPMYIPEVAFTVFLAGRNMVKPPDSVKGGTNGIGGKLIVVHSKEFAVETVAPDANGALNVYVQIFRDRMREREAPKIFSARSKEAQQLALERRRPHTRISFVPAYSELGYAPLSAQDVADLEAWCRWRMFLLAAYMGPKVKTMFNGELCPTTSSKALALLAIQDPSAIIMGCTAKAKTPPHSSHPWDITVAVVPGQKKFGQISVINGVHCTKGSHLTYIKKILNGAVSTKLARAIKSKNKKTSVTDTCKQVFLVIVGALPGADWDAQRKSQLQVAETKLRPYSIAPTVLGKIAGIVVDHLLQNSEKSGRKGGVVEADKYTPAKRAGTKDRGRCCLLAAEGDSAIAPLRVGLTLGPRKNPGGPSFDHYGIISLGGVIMNAMRQVTEHKTAGGDTILVRSNKLRDNKILKALTKVLGLDYSCKYADKSEIAKLPYSSVCACTDQDLDGTGKILPLLLVWFHLFWPNLIKHGFVQTFKSPVIRAYPKKGGEPAEFFYEKEFERWAQDGGGVDNHTIKYYKGLGAHDDDEVARMFRNFNSSVYTFTLDDSAAELFEVYFGSRAALRKVALSTPVAYLSYDEAKALHRSRLIPCSVQLRIDVKACKLDIIQRQIPGIDGIPVARRKILTASLRRFGNSNREVKVFQLGGYVAEHMLYHHGEASLNSTITGMAQRFPGALQFPYLVAKGQFGTRHAAGRDASSARYISVKLAAPYAKAMLPAEDTWLLPHVFEDGERAQPKYFLPVLPSALLESFAIPSEGWRHKSYARDLDQVVALTRAYLGQGPPAAADLVARVAWAAEAGGAGHRLETLDGISPEQARQLRLQYPLGVSLRGYGRGLSAAETAELVRPYKGYSHSFGWYTSSGDKQKVIHVGELPLRKSTESFLKKLREEPARARFIDRIDDYSGKLDVDISIYLVPGAWDEICATYGSSEIDPVEDFLLLRTSLRPYLNYYSHEGRVIEFGDDYHALFFHWAPLRRDLYRARFVREATLLQLKIRVEEETVRYISVSRDLDLAHKASEAEAGAALAKRGFPMFDTRLLTTPRYTPAAELKVLITEGVGVSYDYLLNLRERDLVITAQKTREARLQGLRDRLNTVNGILAEKPFAGASIWAAEIADVVSAVRRGEASNWQF